VLSLEIVYPSANLGIELPIGTVCVFFDSEMGICAKNSHRYAGEDT